MARVIDQVLGATTSSVVGEITRELVNASDGAGLHFEDTGRVSWTNTSATNLGTSDFSVEFVLNQTAENTSDNYIWFTNASGNNRAYLYNDISDNVLRLVFINSSGSASGTNLQLAYDMSADYNTPTHYTVTVDRSGDATLYKNGNSVASVSVSAASAIDLGNGNSNVGQIGSSAAGYSFLGTMYRFRTYNKALSSAEVQTAYERADVDYSSQYGSQTNKFASPDNNWGTNAADATAFNAAYAWTSYQTSTIAVSSNVLTFTTSADGRGIFADYSLTAGKRYRVTMATGAISGATYQLMTRAGSVYTSIGTLAASTTNVFDFTAPAGAYSGYLYLYQSGSGSGSIALTAASVTNELVQTGVVSDYDLAFANPTQSLTVQDRSGAADGTASTSGVTQVQPVVQLNSTSARIGTSAATPADGAIIADKLGIGIAPSHAATIYGTGAGNATVQIEGEGGADPTINFLTNNTTHWAVGVDDSDSDKFKIVKHSAIGSTNNFFTIDTSGNVMIGSGTAGRLLELSNATNPALRINNGNSTADIGVASSAGALLTGAADDDLVIARNGSYGISVGTNGTARLAINSAGDITSTNATASKPVLTLENTTNDANSSQLLFLKNRTATNNDILGTIRFRGNNNAGTPEITEYATIYAQATDVTDSGEDGQLIFRTMKDGSLGARLTIDGTGLASFSNGINLGHENLTKYDEGSFTPTIGAETGTINGTNRVGRYTRIGNVCHVWFSIECTGVSGASGAVEFGNFPFTSSSIASDYNTPMVVRYVSLGSAVESLVLRLFNSSTGGRIEEQNGTSVTNLADNVQNGTIFQVAGAYRLASG